MYLKEHNTLLMPAGVLIEPIFDFNNPIYLNYATVGTYLSHELFHMIHEEIHLASEATQIAYHQKLNCLRNNYVKYVKTKHGFDIEGEESISEQIADTFGILVSYKSFMEELISSQSNQVLPGLKYTQEQLFFIRYAQSYCRKRTITGSVNFEQMHVSHDYRAMQVSLTQEFSDIFQCKNSLQSNDLDKCKVFDV